MVARITQDDKDFRHTPLFAMCVALGYISVDEVASDPHGSARRFYDRVDEAIRRGDVVKPEGQAGHYRLTEEAYRRLVDTFSAARRAA